MTVNVIEETDERTTTTAAGAMAGLAAPSQGSRELASWRVRMPGNATGPVHAIDREQVFMPLVGTFTITVDGGSADVSAGQAVILPAGAIRQIRAGDTAAEALVCMAVGGSATVPGSPEPRALPWAQ